MSGLTNNNHGRQVLGLLNFKTNVLNINYS